MRSRIYDEQIRQFIHETGIAKVSLCVVNSAEAPPAFKKPDFSLECLLAYGNLMVKEQQQVQNTHALVEEYNQVRGSDTRYAGNSDRFAPIRNQVPNA